MKLPSYSNYRSAKRDLHFAGDLFPEARQQLEKIVAAEREKLAGWLAGICGSIAAAVAALALYKNPDIEERLGGPMHIEYRILAPNDEAPSPDDATLRSLFHVYPEEYREKADRGLAEAPAINSRTLTAFGMVLGGLVHLNNQINATDQKGYTGASELRQFLMKCGKPLMYERIIGPLFRRTVKRSADNFYFTAYGAAPDEQLDEKLRWMRDRRLPGWDFSAPLLYITEITDSEAASNAVTFELIAPIAFAVIDMYKKRYTPHPGFQPGEAERSMSPLLEYVFPKAGKAVIEWLNAVYTGRLKIDSIQAVADSLNQLAPGAADDVSRERTVYIHTRMLLIILERMQRTTGFIAGNMVISEEYMERVTRDVQLIVGSPHVYIK